MDLVTIKIIGLIWIAMVATGIWESSIEGGNAWDKGKHGWKIKFKKHVLLTRYHFFLFWVMFPAILAIPLVMDFSWRLFGIILSAYSIGMVIEDFTWYLTNPVLTLRHFNKKDANWYWWVAGVPAFYWLGLIVSVASYLIFWA